MQIFCPLPDPQTNARCLDQKRLGRQFWYESVILYRGKWPNHPASKMFRNHPGAFCAYNLHLVYAAIAHNWYKPLTWIKWIKFWTQERDKYSTHFYPAWWGDNSIHSRHRAILLHKNPTWYSQFNWTETPLPPDPLTNKYPYIWPED